MSFDTSKGLRIEIGMDHDHGYREQFETALGILKGYLE